MSDSRLNEVRMIDPVLSELAAGYANPAYVAKDILPEIEVEKEAGKIPIFTKESFKIRNTVRNINNPSNRIMTENPRTIDIVLDEHDLEAPMDYREGIEASFNKEKQNTFVVTEGVLLKTEKLAADLICDPSKYAASNVITLSGNDKLGNPASDPVGIIENARNRVAAAIAREPNVLAMSFYMYKCLKNHPALTEKIKYTNTGILTLQQMKEIFEVDKIVIGRAVYSDEEGTKPVWGKNIILSYSPKGQTEYEPSFGYTLRMKDMPQVDTYTESGGKIKIVRYTTIEKAVLTGMDAGFLITEAE